MGLISRVSSRTYRRGSVLTCAMTSTKSQADALINDLDCISRQIVDQAVNDGSNKTIVNTTHQDKLFQLMNQTETRLNAKLETARQLVLLERKLQTTRERIHVRDRQLQIFLRRLKKSEQLLADALHQAKQKLKIIKTAEASNVSTDELIRYSYIISQAGAVAAPGDWTNGDVRKPFPTELEMRCGMLARFSENQTNDNTNQTTDLTELTSKQKEIIQQIPPRQGDVEGILEQTKIWPVMPTISSINNDDNESQHSSQNTGTDNDTGTDEKEASDADSNDSYGWG